MRVGHQKKMLEMGLERPRVGKGVTNLKKRESCKNEGLGHNGVFEELRVVSVHGNRV